MGDCELCRGLRGHQRLKDVMCEGFEAEHQRAQREYDRLATLFKEVCWYNFETKCRSWKHPWAESWQWSPIELHGVRVTTCRSREFGEFPVYYQGPICDAPSVPPEIILVELQAAAKYLEWTTEQVTAPHDWAPGGCMYQKLLMETSVPTDLHRRSKEATEAIARISKRVLNDQNGGRGRYRRKQRDTLGGTTQADAQSTTKDLLGRVRGNRSMVSPEAS